MKKEVIRTSISMDARVMEDLKIEAIKKRTTVSKLLENILVDRKPNKFKDLDGGQ
jgi:hypothetical protein